MKILIAKTAGFCMGVRRAVEMALDAPRKYKGPIYNYGPLIHNPQVLNLLQEKGISVINGIPDHGSGVVLIRAHGVPPGTKEKFNRNGFAVIDATCPRVVKVQTIIKKHTEQDYASIIIGDKDHPEVVGLLGYAGDKGYVAANLKDIEALPPFDKAIIVAQTTQNSLLFEDIKKWARRRFPHYKLFDTICDSTAKRQHEVSLLAETVDALVIVGGHNSGNTRRLAEIARESGKPAYHIETESELDIKALASAQSIGITAGASTPNWITKKVFRALERWSHKKGQICRRTLFAMQHTLLLTNIYVSIGAGCLCYAVARLHGSSQYFPHMLISILYVQSMHILNNLTGTEADRYNDPDRAAFYNKNKVLLVLLALVAGGAGLLTAYTMGISSFLILFAMSAMGLSYNLKLVPEHFAKSNYRRIRDIPGSKTVLIAVAWGIVTSVLPSFSESGWMNLATTSVFLTTTCLVFARTAFFDILDMQGDRIVGKETIPILIGEKATMRLLKAMLITVMVILFLSSAFHTISSLGFALILCPVFMLSVILTYERGYIPPGIRLEFLVETDFVLAGILTVIWSVF